MGRKTVLDADVQKRIATLVNAGAPLPMACEASGVSWNTAKGWMRRGRDGEKPFSDFVDAIAEAKAAFVCGSAMRITKAADKDWKAAAWLLERRSDHFVPKSKQQNEHSFTKGASVTFVYPDNGRVPAPK